MSNNHDDIKRIRKQLAGYKTLQDYVDRYERPKSPAYAPQNVNKETSCIYMIDTVKLVKA